MDNLELREQLETDPKLSVWIFFLIKANSCDLCTYGPALQLTGLDVP
jgi:hypothetical protein